MDKYTKTVLTVIAISLTLIAAKLWEPREAQAGVFGNGPTWGEYLDLGKIKDPAQRREAIVRLKKSIPLIRIHSGHVDVDAD